MFYQGEGMCTEHSSLLLFSGNEGWPGAFAKQRGSLGLELGPVFPANVPGDPAADGKDKKEEGL